MVITLNDALKGKATRIKNKEYFETKAYIEPFIDRMSKFTNDFRIRAVFPDQITKTKSGEINMDDITFNRMWIQAVLPGELQFPNHYEAIHLLYALDTKKPVVKIARSAVNAACLNQCVFNPTFINIQSLEPETCIKYNIIDELMYQTNDIVSWLNRLSSIEIPYEEEILNKRLGFWIRGCMKYYEDLGLGKIKLATSTAISAFKDLYDNEKSPYYVNSGESTTLFNVYNAFTDIISHDKKDITNVLEKTILLKRIIELV